MMKSKKYIIYAPRYKPNSGGAIVLHKLCSVLNDLGAESYLYIKGNKKNKKRFFKKKLLNPKLNAKIYNGKIIDIDESFIIVYPEIVEGNPLSGKNVVRWLLHKPGFHTGKVDYSEGELYYRFESGLVSSFHFKGSKTSDLFLNITHMPTDIYNTKGASKKRKGTAYLIRKGTDKKIIHDLNDSILIDGKSHKEISKIFKKVKQFISYDEYSAYATFALLCGCESIIVPDKGKTKYDWYPDPEKSAPGLRYGFDDIDINIEIETENLKLQLIKKEKENESIVKCFFEETQRYFK